MSSGITLVLIALFILALVTTVNFYLVNYFSRGGLQISAGGVMVNYIWRRSRYYRWEDIDHFEASLVDPNDSQTRLSVGFFLKLENQKHRFVKFPLETVLSAKQLVMTLEYMRLNSAANQDIMVCDLKTLVSLADAKLTHR